VPVIGSPRASAREKSRDQATTVGAALAQRLRVPYPSPMKFTVPLGLSCRIGIGLVIGLPCSSKAIDPLAPFTGVARLIRDICWSTARWVSAAGRPGVSPYWLTPDRIARVATSRAS
jgi:hypothetical protein